MSATGLPAREYDQLLVATRQLDLSYRRLPLSAALSMTVPLIFVWLMRPLYNDGLALRWLSVVWGATLVRGALWFWWRRTGFDGTNIRPWAWRLWVTTMLAACGWASAAMMLAQDASAHILMMVGIMATAVGAIGASALGSHLPSAIGFIVVVLGPTAVHMTASPDLPVQLSGLGVVVAIIALSATVWRAHRELSQLIRTELQLQNAVSEAVQARAAAEEASRAKSAFLANMSHELRTPLNAIIGYSEILLEDARDAGEAETSNDLERVTNSAHHLLALINDVLDLSKIEAGRMELELETVKAIDVLSQVIDTSRGLAAAGRNTLTVSGLDSLGTMHTDALKFKQVLLNLLSNACKFTSNGRVEVTGRREPSASGDWIVVSVRDTGIGMTPDQVGRIFGQFVQADSSTTKKYGGTGLGLAISQRLCRLMGGEISVESRFGLGTTFVVRLPADVRAPESAAA